ncbi:MAG: transcription antitermination protein NusB [Alphaproteobacteria bacterium]|nr:transcription antitermination protein NusB [Alphaproteobacteria bacterium]
MSEQTVKKQKSSDIAMKRAARLLAVQAIYQYLEQGGEASKLVTEFLTHRSGMIEDGETMVSPDPILFKTLMVDVIARHEDMHHLVDQNRSVKEGAELSTLEPLLRAILLCGATELTVHLKTDFPVIISDYVDISKAFYQGREPGLVNAVLDSIRKVVRN